MNLSATLLKKVLCEGKALKDGNVFYKCARNWEGIVLPGLIVTTQGFFYVCCEQGVFLKPVSQKDRFCITIVCVSLFGWLI